MANIENSSSKRFSALPPSLAPRLILREAAAAYVSVSPNTFDLLVRDGTMPKPRRLTGRRKAWDTRELDLAIDCLPRDGDDGAADETWGDIDAT
jgi:predicted DNA-binding transcriptional regulator AlpA